MVLVESLSILLLGTRESEEPLYLVFYWAATVLILATGFIPLISGVISAALFLAFVTLFPENLGLFQLPIEFSAAVLLAHLKWKQSLALTAICFTLTAIGNAVTEGHATPYSLLFYLWMRNSLLALVAALVQVRLEKEISLREHAVRDHEKANQQHELQLQKERVQFAVDVHDTVSHGLARQSNIIRILSTSPSKRDRSHLLSELVLSNSDTHYQLRSLLIRLNEIGRGTVIPPTADHELHSLKESLQRAAEAGQLQLQLNVDLPADVISSHQFNSVKQSLREMLTNMVRHTEGPQVHLSASTNIKSRQVVLESRNPSNETESKIPKSLAMRAEIVEGTITADLLGGEFLVRIQIPF